MFELSATSAWAADAVEGTGIRAAGCLCCDRDSLCASPAGNRFPIPKGRFDGAWRQGFPPPSRATCPTDVTLPYSLWVAHCMRRRLDTLVIHAGHGLQRCATVSEDVPAESAFGAFTTIRVLRKVDGLVRCDARMAIACALPSPPL